MSQVFDTLRTEILTGALRPGDPINETAIAARLDVSHTPVREAIMDLIGQGFVEGGSNRRRHVAHYSPRRAVEIVQLQGLLHQLALLRIAEVASAPEIAELAEKFEASSRALLNGDGPAIDAATADLVATECRLARHSALSIALPRASQRGFALVLLPDEAWEMWRNWGSTLAGFAAQLRAGEVSRTADDYLAHELAIADRIAELWPEPLKWPDSSRVGQTRAEAVADRIRREIQEGTLAAGEPLREVDLARRHGVSTTPVREALHLLVADGLVVIEPNRRRRVATRTDAEAADLIDLLRHLVNWQLSQAATDPAATELAMMAAAAGELPDLVRQNGFAETIMTLSEGFSRMVGNREVWTVVQNALSLVLPRCARTALAAPEFTETCRALASLSGPEVTSQVPILVNRLFDISARW